MEVNKILFPSTAPTSVPLGGINWEGKDGSCIIDYVLLFWQQEVGFGVWGVVGILMDQLYACVFFSSLSGIVARLHTTGSRNGMPGVVQLFDSSLVLVHPSSPLLC